jgi:paraquat-inducible protein B
MSKQANTTLIGGFVVGAIALVVAGVFVFGSGKWFKEQRKFVLFFRDSVKGLTKGSPVTFKGVKVGTVTDIRIVLDKKDLSLGIPVFVQLDPAAITYGTSESEMMKEVASKSKGEKNFIELLIEKGLKAQLEMQSMVTGQLGINLDFFPNDPITLVGTQPDYTEIPTVESSLSEFMKTVANIPIAEIANKVSKTLDGIEKLVNSPELKGTIVSFDQAAAAAHELLKNLDAQVKPLVSRTDLTLDEAKTMFASAAQVARNLDGHLPKIMAGLEDTLKATSMTMRGANKAVEGMAGDNSPVRLELIKTLSEFSSAARSFRILAQYLENHPEALVRGKGK